MLISALVSTLKKRQETSDADEQRQRTSDHRDLKAVEAGRSVKDICREHELSLVRLDSFGSEIEKRRSSETNLGAPAAELDSH